MPTVSEPTWPERDDRIKIAVQQFVEAKSFSVDDSVYVLSARLFGLGLRGQTLRTEVWHAESEKHEYRLRRIAPLGRALNYDAQIVAKLSNKSSYVGQHEDFKVEQRPAGFFWVDTRSEGQGQTGGPFETSRRAYAAFHNCMGWELLE